MGGDVADEPAGEAVAGTGRVDDRLQRERGESEEALLGDHRGAVLALLGDDHARTPLADLAGGADEVRLLRAAGAARRR